VQSLLIVLGLVRFLLEKQALKLFFYENSNLITEMTIKDTKKHVSIAKIQLGDMLIFHTIAPPHSSK